MSHHRLREQAYEILATEYAKITGHSHLSEHPFDENAYQIAKLSGAYLKKMKEYAIAEHESYARRYH